MKVTAGFVIALLCVIGVAAQDSSSSTGGFLPPDDSSSGGSTNPPSESSSAKGGGCDGAAPCGTGGSSGTCQTSLIAGPAYTLPNCPANSAVNVSTLCIVACAPGYTGRAVTRLCNGQDQWSQGTPECVDEINACRWWNCAANASCEDLGPPAVNNSDGRVCECYYGYVGNPYTTGCALNHSVPCLGNHWSPSGNAPCEPCRQCTTNVVAPCTPTSNTECSPADHCGWIQGDPHFQSLDGAYYDFQGYGEFFALRSIQDSSVSIQTRFLPCSTGVTCMTGAAFGSGNNAVSIQYDQTTTWPRNLRVYQGQNDVTATLPITIDGVSFVESTSSTYGTKSFRVSDPANTITVTLVDYGWLSGTFCVSSSQYDKLDGLLGLFDGNPSNDNPNNQGLARRFVPSGSGFKVMSGESWRVTEQQSELHYGTNETYASNNDPTFVPYNFDNFHPSDAAVLACAGLTGEFLQSCLRDVTATGETSFATGAQSFANVVQDVNNPGGASSDAARTAVGALVAVVAAAAVLAF